ncbi:MAG: hypothetical protein EOP87_06970 [Verrucomicrobiaceae bacterium]|nr:MAG: hypothetical protein EOP87_06970 [Verrucomicrobiaceae bacterium]
MATLGFLTGGRMQQYAVGLWGALFFILPAAAEDRATADRSWWEKPVSGIISEFPGARRMPCPADGNLIAVYCEKEPQWWGHLKVFRRDGDRVAWGAVYPPEYLEGRGHHIVTCRWVSLATVDNPVILVVESSHMGNGSLFLMELDGREFRILLSVSARGRIWSVAPELEIPFEGGAWFAGKHPDISFVNEDGRADGAVVLDGGIEVRDQEDRVVATKHFSQRCVWDPAKRHYNPGEARISKGR